jgi:hypothetical protein
MEIVALLYDIDDFCQQFVAQWQPHLVSEDSSRPFWTSRLCLSEVMTIIVSFHLFWGFPTS